MREIKFRVFDKRVGTGFTTQDDGHFYITSKGSIWDVNENVEVTESVIVMQYTGLKDRNGVEIYEGDIVTAWSEGQCRTLQVKWRQGGTPCWILYPAWSPGISWSLNARLQEDGTFSDDVEVIGNVYQHSHLLEEERT